MGRSSAIRVQILFTEEDAVELRRLREALEPRGYDVASARLGEWRESELGTDGVVALLGGSPSRGEELEALGELSVGFRNLVPVVVIASPEKAGWIEESLHWGATDHLLRDPGGVHIRMLPAVLGRAFERAHALIDLEKRQAEIGNLFDNAPVSLWREDFSALVERFAELRADGIADFRSYFESHPEEVRDLAGKVEILDVNQAALELHAAETKKELMRPLPRFFDDQSYEIFREELIALAEGETRFEAEGSIRTMHGSTREVLFRIFLDSEVPDGSLAYVAAVDLTALRRSEAKRLELLERSLQFQRLESLGVLAGGVAHDFNNVLVSILGHADLAMAGLDPDSPLTRDLEPIISGAEKAADLCRQMLAFAGQNPVATEEVDLGQLIAQMRELLRTSFPSRIRLELEAPVGLATIDADPTLLRQVVMNLVLNAVEAIGESSGTVSISMGLEECIDDVPELPEVQGQAKTSSYAVLSVSDTGCGMSEEVQSRLFEPFFSTKFTGRGLGSSAILGIAQKHGGTVLVESEVDQGSTVRVLFPIAESMPPDGQATTRDDEPVLEKVRGSGTVLVIDDEIPVRDFVRAVLQQAGFSVLLAEDGDAGVSLFRAHRDEIVCVLLDWSMPGRAGDEVLVDLRKLDAGVPVILSSGYGVEDVLGCALEQKPDAFIQKPYRVDPLLRTIHEAIG